MTERVRSQMRAFEMRFLRKIEGITMFEEHRNTEIRESLDIELLLSPDQKISAKTIDHVSRMPQKRLPKQILYVKVSGKRPVRRPRARWLNYIEDIGWNRLKLYPSEMQIWW